MTKEFLSKQQVPFISKNINEPQIRDELRARGFWTVPVTFVDGKGYDGFKPDLLSKVLNLNGTKTKTSATTTNMYERMDQVLAAWGRAIRQLSQKQLSLDAGVGSMDLRRYAHVIPHHVRATMLARKDGFWDPKDHFQNRGWRKMKDPETLANYGEWVRTRFKHWSSTLTSAELKMPCTGFYGDVDLSRLIEISLGRCAFHLRRLYGIMREQGRIEPKEPMDDKELEAIGVPAKVMGQ